MSRLGGRGRRTRVYDCNYNTGESYYKSAIDRLDRKQSGRTEVNAAGLAPTTARDLEDRYNRAFEGEDLESARRRAEKTISGETLFDSRGGRTARGRPLSTAVEEADNDFDEEVERSLNRLRATKKKSVFLDDIDTTVTRSRASEKILEISGVKETAERVANSSSSSSRASLQQKDSAAPMVRWTALEDGGESAAAARARATRARLADLDDDIEALSVRRQARERRVQDLRSFLAENTTEAF